MFREDEFPCRSFGEECISQELTCDGKLDCSNGNDETLKTCEFKVWVYSVWMDLMKLFWRSPV